MIKVMEVLETLVRIIMPYFVICNLLDIKCIT